MCEPFGVVHLPTAGFVACKASSVASRCSFARQRSTLSRVLLIIMHQHRHAARAFCRYEVAVEALDFKVEDWDAFGVGLAVGGD